MTHRSTILKLIEQKPKHFSKMIRNNSELKQWVETYSLVKSTNFSHIVYSAINQTDDVCARGQTKKFLSINDGYGFCGPAAKCPCARDSVAKKVSESKCNYTPEVKQQINQKRAATNLEKYGVPNAGQTQYARQQFSNWYADPENVSQLLDRVRETNREKYGVENCKSLPEVEQKIIATCLSRYGVTNVSQIPSVKAKLRARTANYKLTKHLLSKGYDKFVRYVEENYNFFLVTTFEEYQGCDSGQVFEFVCLSCGDIKHTKFNYGPGLSCNICNPRLPAYTSKEEQQVFDFVTQELGIIGYQSDKSLINPYELDMVFPQHKIAIEYCGLYWHSELSSNKHKNYHRDKMIKCQQAGYRLITIFSDEWLTKNHIVRTKLAHLFSKNSRKYHARKLLVDTVSAEQAKQFLNQYHLQGTSSAKINLGLFNDGQLVALMTFSNGRAALNTKSNAHVYELVRFVTDGASVAGGASKLLSYFIKTYQPNEIFSYSDCRWSQGQVYETIGFAAAGKPTIGYWYVDDYRTRIHRYNFTKNQLIKSGNDPGLTEWEIVSNLGYDRIWDCGHQKYIMTIKEV
jgi:hypothetical protein